MCSDNLLGKDKYEMYIFRLYEEFQRQIALFTFFEILLIPPNQYKAWKK